MQDDFKHFSRGISHRFRKEGHETDLDALKEGIEAYIDKYFETHDKYTRSSRSRGRKEQSQDSQEDSS